MTRAVFEIKRTDAAGRLGRLEIPRADLTIETPAMMPVVNPHLQRIEPRRLWAEFGAEMLITNAYVLHQSETWRADALSEGVHDILEFPGAVMTDSGAFQLAEYGSIDVDTAEILEFQDRIGSDIATPVDIPTPPDEDRASTTVALDETIDAIRTARSYEAGDMLIAGPIQGSTYADMREQAARRTYAVGPDIYPIGAVVPLLRAYRFDDVTRIIDGAKRGLGADAPVHLFGAGHPMMFALGVALGCDLFDSAAYALYAREERYLTVGGTHDLDELAYFPCECPICVAYTPNEVRQIERDERERLLSEHNLYVTFGEIRRVKQAIRRGELLELVERRVRAHPRLLDGYRAALDRPERWLDADPVSSPRPMFYVSSESARRPEVLRHHQRLSRVSVPSPILLLDHALEREVVSDLVDMAAPTWAVTPPFGPIPPALEQTYPLTAELPRQRDQRAILGAVDGIRSLCRDRAVEATLVHADWPVEALARLPGHLDTVTVRREYSA